MLQQAGLQRLDWATPRAIGARRSLSAIGVAAALLLCTGTTQAASFDCDRAQTATEKTICQVRSLNDADVQLATTYRFSLHALAMGSRDQQRDLQAAWLKQRNACGIAISCLKRQYNLRQVTLDRLLQQRVLSHAPF